MKPGHLAAAVLVIGMIGTMSGMALGGFLDHEGTMTSPSSSAPSADHDQQAFRRWLEQQVWQDAAAKGVSRATFDAALGNAQLLWSLPDLIKPGQSGPDTKGQTEFGRPAHYFKPGNIEVLVKRATPLLERWRKELDAIEGRYGVPREIIVAIWGRESNFGSASLPYSAVEALATESFTGARKELFYPELIAALQILQQGHVRPAEMRSSWAGALGNPQFMPSKFLQFAVDFDGDGRRDIWNSIPDTLASIAHFLQQHGWQKGRGWGQEINIPASLSCTLEGPDQGKPLAAWEKLGVRSLQGSKLPKGESFILFPAGRFGPVFLVSKNFYVLKDYNESDLYALFIGHLADRMGRGTPFQGSWGEIGSFKREDVRQMQLRLEKMGHDVGSADGLVGFKTRRSIGRWQEQHGLEASCFPDAGQIGKIR